MSDEAPPQLAFLVETAIEWSRARSDYFACDEPTEEEHIKFAAVEDKLQRVVEWFRIRVIEKQTIQ